jgi:hypothetical protein
MTDKRPSGRPATPTCSPATGGRVGRWRTCGGMGAGREGGRAARGNAHPRSQALFCLGAGQPCSDEARNRKLQPRSGVVSPAPEPRIVTRSPPRAAPRPWQPRRCQPCRWRSSRGEHFFLGVFEPSSSVHLPRRIPPGSVPTSQPSRIPVATLVWEAVSIRYQPCASPCGDRKTKPGFDSLICRSPTVGRTHRCIVVTGCHITTVRICSSRWASRRVHRSGERIQTSYVKPWPASLGCSRRRQPGRLA